MHRRQQEDLRQVVHVNEVVELAAGAAHDGKDGPPGHLEDLEEAPVAGPVDGGRPDDGERQALPWREVAEPELGIGLGLLVDVARVERVLLVGRRMLDMAVHADGGHMNKPLEAGIPQGSPGQEPGALDMDLAVGLVGNAGLAVGGRDMKDHLDAGGSAVHGGGIEHLPLDPLDRQVRARARGGADDRPDTGAAFAKFPDKDRAGEAGGTGDKYGDALE